MNRQWFTIRTQPRRELLARQNYERQGFISYLPQHLVTIRHARRVEQVPRPFFPGYLFLHLSAEERRWSSLGSTIGSIGPVRFGDVCPPVPDWMIEGLLAREDEMGFISEAAVRDTAFKTGDRVLVVWNNMQELEGIFRAEHGKDRALILLEILRRQVRAVVPITALRAGGRR
jgi:transcriptional antiterminator RfaH